MRMNLDVFGMFPSVESAGRRLASLPGSSGASSPASTVLSRRYDSLPPVPPHFVAFVWRYLRVHSFISLPGGRVHRRGLELFTRYLRPGSRCRRRQDLPSSWGTPIARLPWSVDAGGTAGTRPLRRSGMAPGIRTVKAPAKGLSTLNSMASGLAVYASPGGLPRRDARLASSRWSGAAGRAFHPQGPDERFQSACDISSPFPKLAWRNRIDRSRYCLRGLSDGGGIADSVDSRRGE